MELMYGLNEELGRHSTRNSRKIKKLVFFCECECESVELCFMGILRV